MVKKTFLTKVYAALFMYVIKDSFEFLIGIATTKNLSSLTFNSGTRKKYLFGLEFEIQ